MENMFNTILSHAEDNFSRPVADIHKLGIHFTPKGIVLIAIRIEKSLVSAFQVLEYPEQYPDFDDVVADKVIDYLLSQHPWFADTDINITALLPGRGFTLVPDEVYDSFNKEHLMEPQYYMQTGDVVFAEKLGLNPVMAVYALTWNWNHKLRTHFSKLKIHHEDVCWINLALSGEVRSLSDHSALVYLENDKLKILLIQQGKLHYFNTFSYQVAEDVLYYLQLALTQFGLDPASFHVYLAGTSSSDLSVERLLESYFNSVYPVKFSFFNNIPSSMKKNYPALYLAPFSLITCG